MLIYISARVYLFHYSFHYSSFLPPVPRLSWHDRPSAGSGPASNPGRTGPELRWGPTCQTSTYLKVIDQGHPCLKTCNPPSYLDKCPFIRTQIVKFRGALRVLHQSEGTQGRAISWLWATGHCVLCPAAPALPRALSRGATCSSVIAAPYWCAHQGCDGPWQDRRRGGPAEVGAQAPLGAV